jgi:Undecaprenyl-phosphate glucose phosphotransferase
MTDFWPEFRTRSGTSTRSRAADTIALNNSLASSGGLSKPLLFVAVLEFCGVVASGYVAALLYCGWTLGYLADANRYLPLAVWISLVEVAALVTVGYSARALRYSRIDFCWGGVVSVAAAALSFLAGAWLSQTAQEFSRGAVLLQLAATAGAAINIRAVFYPLLHSMWRSGSLYTRRAILVGDIQHCLSEAPRLRAAGVLPISSIAIPTEVFGKADELTAVLRNLARNCRHLNVDDIYLLADLRTLPLLAENACPLAELPVNVQLFPIDALGALSKATLSQCGDMTIIRFIHKPLSLVDRSVKRAFDLCAAAAGLLMLSPMFALISLAIKLESPGPAMFTQRRHGYNGAVFRIYKFRTMSVMEDGDHFQQVTKNDIRVTRLGHFLRRTNLDELPQLLNVLIGEMSIVGPRPHAISHNDEFDGRIRLFWRRHNVKPGITGWAQVNGCRGETDTIDKMQRRVEYDLEYIENYSFWLDLKIILATPFRRAVYAHAY